VGLNGIESSASAQASAPTCGPVIASNRPLPSGFSYTGDLWSYRFSTGKAETIDTAARWDTAAFVAGGRGVVYLKVQSGASLLGDVGPLVTYDFASGTTTTLSAMTAVSAIKLSPDHARIAFADGYATDFPNNPVMLKLWTFADGSVRVLEPTGGTLRGWSPDSAQLAYFTSVNLNLWDVHANQKATISMMGLSDAALVFSAKSDKVAFQIPLNVDVYDIAAKTTVAAPFDASMLDEIAFTADSSWLTFRTTQPGTTGTTVALSLVNTGTGAVTKVGPGAFGPFSPDSTIVPVFVPVVGGRPVLHLRTLATGADVLVSANAIGNGVVWSDDSKHAVFLTYDGPGNAGVTMRLWDVASGQSRALTSGAYGVMDARFTKFVDGGTRLAYLAFGSPGGTIRSSGYADLYLMDLASTTAVRLGESVNTVYYPDSASFLTRDGSCAVLMPGYTGSGLLANLAAVSLTGPVATGGTMLDYGVAQFPIALSPKRVVYVISGGLYASALPCASGP